MKNIITFVLLLSTSISYGLSPDWSKDSTLPGQRKCKDSHGHLVCYRDGNRENLYQLDEQDSETYENEGAKHALSYPVSVSELVLPKSAFDRYFESDTNSPLRKFIYKIAKDISKFANFDDLHNWLGLHKFPQQDEIVVNPIPYMPQLEPFHMGVTIMNRNGVEAISYSCATCHSNNLFGTKVLGLTNRFPKANEIFRRGKQALGPTPLSLMKIWFKATDAEMEIFKMAKNALRYVEVKPPIVLGLDTSLAQVGLSLSRRAKDDIASKKRINALFPRPNKLRDQPADSKPAVWWNLKYKTTWLSDGSIRSGNPVFTNFLWNEIGRGVDLVKLEKWLSENKRTVDELSQFVFSTKAPKYNNFFPNTIDIDLAKRGEKLFMKTCSGCHGEYVKGWQTIEEPTYEQAISTTKIWYHERTPNIDVGTDPYRALGMNYFANDLNRLRISKLMGTVVTPQKRIHSSPTCGNLVSLSIFS